MRISPKSVSYTSPTKVNPKLIDKKGSASSSEPSLQTKNTQALISRHELMKLASDLKQGVISKEEASHQFIDSVVTKSLKEKLGDKDRAQLVTDISEFFLEDQDFLRKLEKNLNDLA